MFLTSLGSLLNHAQDYKSLEQSVSWKRTVRPLMSAEYPKSSLLNMEEKQGCLESCTAIAKHSLYVHAAGDIS